MGGQVLIVLGTIKDPAESIIGEDPDKTTKAGGQWGKKKSFPNPKHPHSKGEA